MALPTPRVINLGTSIRVSYVDNTYLTKDKPFTYLRGDVVSGGSTIQVRSIVGFESLTTSSGQIICIGEIGQENSEILRTSQTTAPTGGVGRNVTLRDTLNFDHPQDTKVYILDFNRAEFNYATTVTGTKVTLTAYPTNIVAEEKETSLRDTLEINNRLGQGTAFYFVRFNDSINSRNSDFSDGVPSGEYDDKSVFAIKQRALEMTGEKVGDLITHDYLNKALWQARREYHNSQGKRPFRRKFNIDIGDASTGSFRINLPTDVESPYSAENVFGVRIGTEPNMDYYDKKEWDFDYRNRPHSTLDVPYTRGTSTSIWLANGRDFSGSPTISVEGMNIGCTRITGSQNSFTITTHGSYPSALAGSDAWENAYYGLPNKFTVWADPEGSAYIYFNRPIDTAYMNQNIYADYYRTLVQYNSDADILDEPNYDMYVNHLAFMIKKKKNEGIQPLDDPDYILWQIKKKEALDNEYLGTDIRISPNVDNLPTNY